MKPTLVVLAAGMGSRYGGIKQIQPVGPNDEIILEYSVFDAIRAGFGKVVFVIRRDIEDEFANHVLKRFSNRISCEYVFQDLDDLPAGFAVPAGRIKPWGTGHAILMTEKKVQEPFAVINADDFYGKDAYQVLGGYLAQTDSASFNYSMVGYSLDKTVSEFGTVSRGICDVDSNGNLRSVIEHTKIGFDTTKRLVSNLADGSAIPLKGNEIVSMNLFGFTPTLYAELRRQFVDFLKTRIDDPRAEIYIPTVANNMVHETKAVLKVLRSHATWFGITYKEDLPSVKAGLDKLIENGEYPARLWA